MSACTSSNSTTNNTFFGWDLLYKTVESSVSRKSDVLVALVHYTLIKECGFQCLGVGEDKTLQDDDVGTELLPDGWNSCGDKYTLRYVRDKQLYLVIGTETENVFIINLWDVKKGKMSNIGLDSKELVKDIKGSLTKMVPTASTILSRYRKELIEPVFTGKTKEITTQTAVSSDASYDSLRVRSDPYGRTRGPYMGYHDPQSFDPLRNIGRGDLDPLGRGPGNLLEFPRRPNAGSFPRFDPYGPDGQRIPPNPNPDHFAPPGSYFN